LKSEDTLTQAYIHTFRSIVDQIDDMDELTEVILFENDLSFHASLYVRLKHPQTIEETNGEATTYENIMAIGKNNCVKYNLSLQTSYTIELNAINTRKQQQQHRFTTLQFNNT
jgi:hypothetical protein